MRKGVNKFSGWFSAVALSISLITLSIILVSFRMDKGPVHSSGQDTCLYCIPQVPDSILFCGERMPVHYTDVHESMQKELIVNNFYHSQTIQILLRSGRYFPIIEKILKEYNVPDDFKYLAAAESALLNATSPAGAVGYWQILSVTAKEYGLEVNNEVDERYHIEKATEFAAKYLTKAYEKYGNWTMAAASYNRGMTGIQRQINRQEEENYYDLLLNSETARYVYRIVALKLILEQPGAYGFCIDKNDYYEPFETKEIKVNGSIPSMADFASEHHTNYKVLKLLNPWLREKKLTNARKKEYSILVPKKKSGLIRN